MVGFAYSNVRYNYWCEELIGAVAVVSKGEFAFAVLSSNNAKIVRYLEDDTVP
jgi:hypothetical protein